MTMPALTYYEPHWYTGIVKCRCSQCHKVVFATEEAALNAVARISERQVMYAYQGKCGHWHLTRRAPSARRTE